MGGGGGDTMYNCMPTLHTVIYHAAQSVSPAHSKGTTHRKYALFSLCIAHTLRVLGIFIAHVFICSLRPMQIFTDDFQQNATAIVQFSHQQHIAVHHKKSQPCTVRTPFYNILHWVFNRLAACSRQCDRPMHIVNAPREFDCVRMRKWKSHHFQQQR